MNLKKIALLITLFMTFAITGCGEGKKNPSEEVKIEYTPIKISDKYPDALKTRDRIMKEIRDSIKSQKVYRIKKDLMNETEQPCPDEEKESHDIWSKKIYVREKMYDSQNREVYKIEDREAYEKGGGSGARKTGGGIYRYNPEEEGIVYDEKGRVKSRIKMLDIQKQYGDSERKSVLRDEEIFGYSKCEFNEYKYDENGNMVKEEITRVYVKGAEYEKEIKEYVNGKVKKSSKVIDCEYPEGNTTLIYVEITKEYDENEKLIKKFVLRKNKFNAVRSETNFDFIKGEIVTKYYDGEKEFATVMETLIGKDRAIVKRERVGDEVKIFDYVEYIPKEKFDYKKYKNYLAYYNKRYVFVNNELKFSVEFLKASYSYNDIGLEGVIDNESYRYESYISSDGADEVLKHGEYIKQIFEYKIKNKDEFEVIEWNTQKDGYINIVKDIMVGKLNENTKEYLIERSKNYRKKEELNKEFIRIFGGI